MHIGLIGGIGLAATEFYYRGLIDRHAGSGAHLDLTIAHADVRELTQNLANNDKRKQADIFVRLVTRLTAAGSGAAAVTSMADTSALASSTRCRLCRFSTPFPRSMP
jgi:aspartate racemase